MTTAQACNEQYLSPVSQIPSPQRPSLHLHETYDSINFSSTRNQTLVTTFPAHHSTHRTIPTSLHISHKGKAVAVPN
jgi:hypothetical protein